MAGPAPGERARAGEQARVRLRDVAVPLGVLLALGLVLRLIIAYVLLPGSGFKVDVASFNGWAVELARNGPFGIYDRPLFIDYTPGYLYVLWALGLLAQFLGGPGAAPAGMQAVAIDRETGLVAAPGTAQISVYPNCKDGRVVADVVRLQKGHTEGLEPNITEELVKLMLSAPGGHLSGR